MCQLVQGTFSPVAVSVAEEREGSHEAWEPRSSLKPACRVKPPPTGIPRADPLAEAAQSAGGVMDREGENERQAVMCSLERRGRVWILTLVGDGEHRLNPGFMQTVLDAVEVVRRSSCGEQTAAAFVMVNEGKFFSNGLDLAWADGEPDARRPVMVSKFTHLLSALMSLPMPTVAAICGHACAGGALLAMAHDHRYMRKDRGYFYMTEVDVNIPLPPGPMLLMREKLAPAVVKDAILRGVRYTGEMALQAAIVDGIYGSSKETAAAALREAELLAARGWDGRIYLSLRQEMHRGSLDALNSTLTTASKL